MSPRASDAIRACLGGYEPSDEQWAAIEHPPVPVAIVAGAGAGKTAVMAARIVSMVENEIVRPSQILALTFTNKAASELEERVVRAFEAMEAGQHELPTVATYNSFADRIVREHGVRVGIDPEVGLLSQAQSWQLLLDGFGSLPPFEAIESRSMPSIVRSALALADACANHLVSPEDLITYDESIVAEASQFPDEVVVAARRRMELARVVAAYREAKRRVGRIDFGDQVTEAVSILTEAPGVAADLRERYPALLLDEYQDTNIAQRKMLQAIAPTGHNVTAVGDARQNIFQWRGSTLFNLIDFPRKHFLREGDEPHDYLPLSENYRSGSDILAVANRIIDQVPADRRPGSPLVAVQHNGPGQVIAKICSDQYAEAEFIVDRITELHQKPAAEGRPDTAWRDFAILVRRRAHIPAIYQELRQRDVPVEVVGLSGLLQVPEVVDTIAWLRVLADPGPTANRWLARILLGPRFRIHHLDLAILARWAQNRNRLLSEAKREATDQSDLVLPDETEFEPEQVAYSLSEALDHLDEIEELPPEARRRLTLAHDELAHLRNNAHGELLDIVQQVIDHIGIVEALDASTREDAASAKGNLTAFLGVVAQFAPVLGEPSLDALLAYLDAAEDAEETLDLATPATGDSVKLMTVHQAKGLEFEVVFLPGVAAHHKSDGSYVNSYFPDTRISNPMTSYSVLPPGVREDAEHLPSPWTVDRQGNRAPKKRTPFTAELVERAIEDERRLFYVALTRAKQLLCVTCAYWYERQDKIKGPSLFFDEVRNAPETRFVGEDPAPEINPLQELLALQAVWPPEPARTIRGDDVFPDGYPVVIDRLLAGELSPDALLQPLGDRRAQAEEAMSDHRTRLSRLAEVVPVSVEHRRTTISATSAVAKVGGRIAGRAMPEKPSEARRIGTEIHRWIEEKARGLTGMADEEGLDLPSAHVPAQRLTALRDAYEEMGFAARRLAKLDTGEPMAELPFVLKAGGCLVRGRIDGVYETEDGGLEVVDFKTGGMFDTPDVDQLLVYAAALKKMGLHTGSSLTLSYVYLAERQVASRTVDEAEIERGLATLVARLGA